MKIDRVIFLILLLVLVGTHSVSATTISGISNTELTLTNINNLTITNTINTTINIYNSSMNYIMINNSDNITLNIENTTLSNLIINNTENINTNIDQLVNLTIENSNINIGMTKISDTIRVINSTVIFSNDITRNNDLVSIFSNIRLQSLSTYYVNIINSIIDGNVLKINYNMSVFNSTINLNRLSSQILISNNSKIILNQELLSSILKSNLSEIQLNTMTIDEIEFYNGKLSFDTMNIYNKLTIIGSKVNGNIDNPTVDLSTLILKDDYGEQLEFSFNSISDNVEINNLSFDTLSMSIGTTTNTINMEYIRGKNININIPETNIINIMGNVSIVNGDNINVNTCECNLSVTNTKISIDNSEIQSLIGDNVNVILSSNTSVSNMKLTGTINNIQGGNVNTLTTSNTKVNIEDSQISNILTSNSEISINNSVPEIRMDNTKMTVLTSLLNSQVIETNNNDGYSEISVYGTIENANINGNIKITTDKIINSNITTENIITVNNDIEKSNIHSTKIIVSDVIEQSTINSGIVSSNRVIGTSITGENITVNNYVQDSNLSSDYVYVGGSVTNTNVKDSNNVEIYGSVSKSSINSNNIIINSSISDTQLSGDNININCDEILNSEITSLNQVSIHSTNIEYSNIISSYLLLNTTTGLSIMINTEIGTVYGSFNHTTIHIVTTLNGNLSGVQITGELQNSNINVRNSQIDINEIISSTLNTMNVTINTDSVINSEITSNRSDLTFNYGYGDILNLTKTPLNVKQYLRDSQIIATNSDVIVGDYIRNINIKGINSNVTVPSIYYPTIELCCGVINTSNVQYGIIKITNITFNGNNIMSLTLNAINSTINVTSINGGKLSSYNTNILTRTLYNTLIGGIEKTRIESDEVKSVTFNDNIIDSQILTQKLQSTIIHINKLSGSIIKVDIINTSNIIVGELDSTVINQKYIFYTNITISKLSNNLDINNILGSIIRLSNTNVDISILNVSKSHILIDSIVISQVYIDNMEFTSLNLTNSYSLSNTTTLLDMSNIEYSNFTINNVSSYMLSVYNFKNLVFNVKDNHNTNWYLKKGSQVNVTVRSSNNMCIKYENVTYKNFDISTSTNVCTKRIDLPLPDLFTILFKTKLNTNMSSDKLVSLIESGIFRSSITSDIEMNIFVTFNELTDSNKYNTLVSTIPYNLSYGSSEVKVYKFDNSYYQQYIFKRNNEMSLFVLLKNNFNVLFGKLYYTFGEVNNPITETSLRKLNYKSIGNYDTLVYYYNEKFTTFGFIYYLSNNKMIIASYSKNSRQYYTNNGVLDFYETRDYSHGTKENTDILVELFDFNNNLVYKLFFGIPDINDHIYDYIIIDGTNGDLIFIKKPYIDNNNVILNTLVFDPSKGVFKSYHEFIIVQQTYEDFKMIIDKIITYNDIIKMGVILYNSSSSSYMNIYINRTTSEIIDTEMYIPLNDNELVVFGEPSYDYELISVYTPEGFRVIVGKRTYLPNVAISKFNPQVVKVK